MSDKPERRLYILAVVNLVIWAIAIIAMVILMQRSPAVRGLAPILMGGTGVGSALLSLVGNVRANG